MTGTCPLSPFREELLSSDFVYEGRKIPVTPPGVHTTTVYVRDLPVELSDESVKSALSVYGDVYSIRHACFKDFPDLRNGNRLLLMSVSTPIPSSFNLLGFVCRTWYSGQPVRCSICKEPDHLPRACAGVVSSPVTWPVSVGRLGASLVLRPLLLFLIQFLFQLIQFLTTLILFLFLFLLLVPGMTGTCPLSPRTILIHLLPIQFLFRPIRPSLLMIFLADLVPSIPNVLRPSQLHFLFLHLKFLFFQDLNLCLFVSKYCLCEEFLYQFLIKCFDWGRGSLPRRVWRA